MPYGRKSSEWSLTGVQLTCLAKLSLIISSKQMTATQFETGTLIQHSGIGGFGKYTVGQFTYFVPRFD